MRRLFLAVMAVASLIGAPRRAEAGILLTVEAPEVQASSVPGVLTESFGALAPGVWSSYFSAIGEYSGRFAAVPPDAYGGAERSLYFSVGIQSQSIEARLDLGTARAYFGFLWCAGDGLNQLDFYDNATLIQSFRTADVIAALGRFPNRSDYYGNPNNGENRSEPYAYLNFFARDGTVFDAIVFRNDNQATGFESDNHSVRTEPVLEITGTPVSVPEPASERILIVGALGSAALLARFRARCLNRSSAD
ncbi:MAG: hypothetical protein U0790_22615 [Isosphaeraceae bacterium]